MDMIDFDLGELSPPPAAAGVAHKAATVSEFGDFTMPTAVNLDQLERGDPLARKLELAEEFRQIGDVEGARDLLEEVIAKAEGALKTKAQVMLDGLA